MYLRYIIAILMGMIVMGASAALSDNGRRLLNECENAIAVRQFPTLLRKSTDLERMGRANGNSTEEIAGQSFRLRALIHMRDTSDLSATVNRLKTLIDTKAPEVAQPQIAVLVARTVSLYYQYILTDYSQASLYAFKSLEASRAAALPQEEIDALSAIASIYFQKQDSTGASYAREAYSKAKKSDNDVSLYVPACNLANYLYNRGDVNGALKLLQEAADKARDYNMTSEYAYLNSFFADIYKNQGQPAKAEEYYRKSVTPSPDTPVYDMVYSHLCYAIFLAQQKRYREALDMLCTTEKMMDDSKVSVFKDELYRNMSIAAEGIGDWRLALKYHKKFMQVELELMNEAKEKEFAILDLRYRVAEEKNKNNEQRLELMRRARMTTILLAVAIILILAVVLLYVYFSKRSRYYKTIIAQYLENAKSEKELRDQLETALTELKETTPRQTSGSSLNEEKASQLFADLEHLMRDEHIYRDCNLSLTAVASMLSTNRTYLSQVVNTKAGKSFAAYVNEYRLNESVDILMDHSNSESLKAIGAMVGFSSPSNFYSLFRQKVGVSPSVFRSNYKSATNP